MAHSSSARRHPLCTCPDDATGRWGMPGIDPANCRGGKVAHPVMTADDIRALVEQFNAAPLTVERSRAAF